MKTVNARRITEPWLLLRIISMFPLIICWKEQTIRTVTGKIQHPVKNRQSVSNKKIIRNRVVKTGEIKVMTANIPKEVGEQSFFDII